MAAWTDYRTGLIPNRLTLSGLLIGLVLCLAKGGGGGLVAGVVGALVVGLVPLLLFRFGAMGGGDVKLFAALGALLGAGSGLEVEMLAFVLGAIQGMAVWVRGGQLRQGLGQVVSLVVPPVFRRRPATAGAVTAAATEIRFGPAIMLATIALLGLRFLR